MPFPLSGKDDEHKKKDAVSYGMGIYFGITCRVFWHHLLICEIFEEFCSNH